MPADSESAGVSSLRQHHPGRLCLRRQVGTAFHLQCLLFIAAYSRTLIVQYNVNAHALRTWEPHGTHSNDEVGRIAYQYMYVAAARPAPYLDNISLFTITKCSIVCRTISIINSRLWLVAGVDSCSFAACTGCYLALYALINVSSHVWCCCLLWSCDVGIYPIRASDHQALRAQCARRVQRVWRDRCQFLIQLMLASA